MRQVFSILLGCIGLLTGLYYSIAQADATQQSVMVPYVTTPDDIAHARALTKEFYAQPVPSAAMRTSPQQSHIRPSAWPVVKHDDPKSLGNGYTMQLIYPKPGIVCSVSRVEATGQIVDSDCHMGIQGVAGYPNIH